MRKLVILGTGFAMATKCFNTCFFLELDDGSLFLTDAGGGNGILRQYAAGNAAVLRSPSRRPPCFLPDREPARRGKAALLHTIVYNPRPFFLDRIPGHRYNDFVLKNGEAATRMTGAHKTGMSLILNTSH